VVSTIHGLVIGTAALKTVLVDGAFWGNVMTVYPKATDTIYSLSLGYQIYDLVTMLLQNLRSPDMWIHHIVCVIGFFFSLV